MRRKPSTRFKFEFTNSHPSEAAIDVQRVRFFLLTRRLVLVEEPLQPTRTLID